MLKAEAMLTFCVFFKKPLNEVALMTPMKRSVTYCNHHNVAVVAAIERHDLLGWGCLQQLCFDHCGLAKACCQC